MTENQNDIDQLLSCYIDGELSQRQETEVRRLVDHNPELAGKLNSMQRQKQLLENMPVENAPQGILGAVRDSLERKFIIDEYSQTGHGLESKRHLLARKLLTTAAMLLLVGVMALVVFNIIRPVEPGDTIAGENFFQKYIEQKTDDQSEQPRADFAVIDTRRPLWATLDLVTSYEPAVNAYLKQAISELGLIHSTIPRHRQLSSSYTINCTYDQASRLVAELGLIWDKCRKQRLTIHGENPDINFTIHDITNREFAALLDNETDLSHVSFAKHLLDTRRMLKPLPGSEIITALDRSINEKLAASVPVKPVLTRDEQEKVSQLAPVAEENPEDKKVHLAINICEQ